MIKPIRVDSLKDLFIKQFEENILSGYFSVGEKLLSERELAAQMGVSRPVVHEGLVDLAAKGLVTMKPRFGTIVNDFRKEGSLALLQSLLNYNSGNVSDNLLESLLEMRILLEVENARLASLKRTAVNLDELYRIVEMEKEVNLSDTEKITELDFSFHHGIAMATGNDIYPLILNSLKQIYTNLSGQFFLTSEVVPVVFQFHKSIADAIREKDDKKSAALMKRMLLHGEAYLKQQRNSNKLHKEAVND